MVWVIAEPRNDMTIIALKKNSIFYAGILIPDQIGHLAKVDRITSGEYRLVIKKDVILLVEDLWNDPCTGARHVLFMREDRSKEGAGSLQFVGVHYYDSALRKALQETNLTRVNTTGGMDKVLVYGDEIAVQEPSCGFGFHGWIIKRADIQKYLKESPSISNPPQMAQLVVWHEVHALPGGGQKSIVRIEGWSKPRSYPEEAATLKSVSEYTIVFDATTRIVHRIFVSNAYVGGALCDRSPIRGIATGKKLPGNLGLNK